MKIRDSFVSNSSSSSFICICEKDVDLSDLDEMEQKLFRTIFRPSKVLGKEALVASEFISSEEFSWSNIFEGYCNRSNLNADDVREDYDLEEKIYTAVFSTVSKIGKKEGSFHEHRDC